MDLQFLFQEPIITVEELSPGYEGHASDVWLVKTSKTEVVVRATRMTGGPSNDFWWGCKQMFGIDPRRVWNLEDVNNSIKPFSSIPVPKVIHKGMKDGREFVVVEKLSGSVLPTFKEQPDSILESLGEGLARIHQYESKFAGNPAGTLKIALPDFHDHLINGATEMVARFYHGTEIAEKLPHMIDSFKSLPTPQSASFVLIDMDPTQFIHDGSQITGLVDTEAYALVPREFEFIGLEYILDAESALAFRKGYERIQPIPDISTYRQPYRYLYRLLSVQGKVEINQWLHHETFF